MKRTRIALYDFVPYGAPELLEAGPTHLTRALTTATSGLVAAFALALCVSAWVAGHPGGRVVELNPGVFQLSPPPSILEHPPQQSAVLMPQITPPAGGVIVPVRDVVAPPDATFPSQIDLRTGPPSDTPTIGDGRIAPPPEPPAVTPGLNDFVYTDEAPAVVSRVIPAYPDLAREAGVDGVVRLRVLVGLDGRVKDVHVDSGSPLLQEAAVAAARQWVFTPALSSKHPVIVWVAIPVHFSLH